MFEREGDLGRLPGVAHLVRLEPVGVEGRLEKLHLIFAEAGEIIVPTHEPRVRCVLDHTNRPTFLVEAHKLPYIGPVRSLILN